jgi:hypothetical protein
MELRTPKAGNATRPLGRVVLTTLLILALLGSGCATSSLWEPQTYHPSDQPELKLAVHEKTRDLLVQYQEQRAEVNKFQPRAYWLLASTNSLAQRGKPVFVNPKNCTSLVPVPLLTETPSTNAPPVAGYIAVPTPAEQGFDLYLDGCLVGRYYLPIYTASPKATPWRVAATPFAALGDTTIVVVVCAAVVGAAAGIIYAESQGH